MRAFLVGEPDGRALRAFNYSPTIERIRRAGSRSARPLSDIVRTFGESYGSRFVNVHCSPQHGLEFLSQGDMFRAEPAGRFIRHDCIPHPARHRIEHGQVLIAGAGTLGETELFGRCLLADDRMVGKHVGPHAVALRFQDPDDEYSLFTYAWLASPTGLQAIRSTCYGTKILGLRLDLLASLPVPVAPSRVVRRVALLVQACRDDRGVFWREVEKARRIALGMVPEGLSRANGDAHPRYVTWTGDLSSFRAWNFASMGERLQGLRRSWRSTLREWLRPMGLFKGGRLARVPCVPPHGVDLFSQRDIFAIRPVPRRIQAPSERLDVDPDYLLIASRGQMNEGALFGRVERAAHTPAGAAVSEDVLRLVPHDTLGPALYSILSSSVGAELLRTTAYGTSIPGMREDLLGDLPLPEPGGRWVEHSAEHCTVATDARTRAAVAEKEAFRIVEEEVVPQWLA